MPDYKYLIIGSGMTANAAIDGIREIDKKGSIGVIGAEEYRPYKRPFLSKKLWKGKPLESVWLKTAEPAAEFHLGRRASYLDTQKRLILDDHSETYHYGKLLLATGGVPNKLPFGGEAIIYYRTLDDYKKVRSLSELNGQIAVIGGGFIGSEMAAALAMNGKKVVMMFLEAGIAARQFPADLSQFLNDFYRQKNVDVLPEESLVGLERKLDKLLLKTKTGSQILADGVIAGLGIQPDIALAQSAGLAVQNGILVDEYLRTSAQDIFAAGDVANFINPALEKRMRVEHEDNANTMGKQAGRNMAGADELYTHLPYFYSDLFDLGYEAVGELDSRLEVFADWQEPFRKGVLYYLADQRVRGVLLWNVWDKVDTARTLISEKGPFNSDNLKGRIS
ncbi:MAG: FAD-dependent oxidoreductase [Anaerolineaceae bacterium]|nr:FAD-dependent oxidoreductase [Anaerolineaceae bacterium]